MHVCIIGAAFSANKGAASMLRAAISGLREARPDCRITVLTTYPAQDTAIPDLPDNTEIVGLSPTALASLAIPATLSSLQCRLSRRRGRWLRRLPALRSILECDVVLDLAGISFVDGRGIPTLGYNTLMTSLPLLLGRPVVKGSQAVGPFEQHLTRIAARSVLRRVTTVCARGHLTADHLRGLGGVNVVEAADLAFLLDEVAESPLRTPVEPTVAVVPSEVVRRFFERSGSDYLAFMDELILGLDRRGYRVRVVPHALRPGQPASKMNDGELAQQIANRSQVELVEGDPSPAQLRAALAACDAVVTSRFHAMVSALATATPVMVIGWSHKYREVLAQFGLEAAALDYRNLDAASALDHFDTIVGSGQRQVIEQRLPEVRSAAAASITAVVEAASAP